jgi:hypothetical protein
MLGRERTDCKVILTSRHCKKQRFSLIRPKGFIDRATARVPAIRIRGMRVLNPNKLMLITLRLIDFGILLWPSSAV